MRRLLRTLASVTLLAALAAAAPPAGARTGIAPAHGFAPGQLVVKFAAERDGRLLRLPAGTGVLRTAQALRANPRVRYAEPNYIATASDLDTGSPYVVPDDPGSLAGGAEAAGAPGSWANKQWNFLPPEGESTPRLPVSPGGIDAPAAWRNLVTAGRPGAEGVVVAVLDTGVAYRNQGGKFVRSPDFIASQFVKGYDFVDEDRLPLDENGHGTHVAGTIGEKTDNAVGLTGLAYR